MKLLAAVLLALSVELFSYVIFNIADIFNYYIIAAYLYGILSILTSFIAINCNKDKNLILILSICAIAASELCLLMSINQTYYAAAYLSYNADINFSLIYRVIEIICLIKLGWRNGVGALFWRFANFIHSKLIIANSLNGA